MRYFIQDFHYARHTTNDFYQRREVPATAPGKQELARRSLYSVRNVLLRRILTMRLSGPEVQDLQSATGVLGLDQANLNCWRTAAISPTCARRLALLIRAHAQRFPPHKYVARSDRTAAVDHEVLTRVYLIACPFSIRPTPAVRSTYRHPLIWYAFQAKYERVRTVRLVGSEKLAKQYIFIAYHCGRQGLVSISLLLQRRANIPGS